MSASSSFTEFVDTLGCLCRDWRFIPVVFLLAYYRSKELWTGVSLVTDFIWPLEMGLIDCWFWGGLGTCRVLWVYLRRVGFIEFCTASLFFNKLFTLVCEVLTFDLAEASRSTNCALLTVLLNFPNIFSVQVLLKKVDSVVFSHYFCM